MHRDNAFLGFLLRFRDSEIGLRLALAIWLALTPNVLVGIWFVRTQNELSIMQSNAEREREVFEHQAAMSSELLSAASGVIVKLYPPGEPIHMVSPREERRALKAEEAFEELYWGRLGLMRNSDLERCLTHLHLMLLNAAEGESTSTSPSKSLEQMESQLSLIADTLREKPYALPQNALPSVRDIGNDDRKCGT